MCPQIINHINNIIHPKEMAEITTEIIRYRTCSISQDIFHISRIQKMMQISSQSRTAVLLLTRLSFSIKQYYIMRLTLKEIIPISRIRIPAVSPVFNNIYPFMKDNK